jgi:tetratricopeptide (TPR) repeat protein
MTPGRNDRCPCGSGRKYKHCCGALAAPVAGRVPAEPAGLVLRGSAAKEGNDAQALIEAANALRARGQPRESVPLYQRALEIDPRSAEAQNNLGNAFLELGEAANAAECYRRALAIRSDNTEILCNLANALTQLGELQEAIHCSERALALDPRLSMAHNNLGVGLAALGQTERALESYRRAVTLNPGYVEALNNLGNLLREMGERREPVALYRRALALDSARADIHCNLGNALFELRLTGEAEDSFRRALALQPGNTQARLGLAAALRMQRRAGEAEASCQMVLAQEPGSAEALVLLGELRADHGRFAEAQELFNRAIALDPTFASGFCSIAAHRRMTADDTAWHEAVQALLAGPQTLAHEINLRYALGKYFDDLGRYDEAFESYRQANELTKRYGARYDRTQLTQRVDRIIARFDSAYMRQCCRYASDSQVPVLIVGMPRSGTSLAEQILASHPAVFGAGEVRFWKRAFAAFEAAATAGKAGADDIAGIASDYLRELSAGSGAALRVTDKMPANFMYAGLIHAVFPRARIIHMQRHPLDTCLSIYFQNFYNMGPYANDLENLAHYYREYVRITDHWRSVLPPAALLEVPYEALIADQEGWTRRMLDFIGLPWDPRCLEFQETERVVITASRWQVRQKISAASAGRWRNYEKYLGPLQHLPRLVEARTRPDAGAPGTSPSCSVAASREIL